MIKIRSWLEDTYIETCEGYRRVSYEKICQKVGTWISFPLRENARAVWPVIRKNEKRTEDDYGVV